MFEILDLDIGLMVHSLFREFLSGKSREMGRN